MPPDARASGKTAVTHRSSGWRGPVPNLAWRCDIKHAKPACIQNKRCRHPISVMKNTGELFDGVLSLCHRNPIA
jgi:hypothetical protein